MGWQNFKKGSDPCPICGNDYCAKLPDDYGAFGVLEKRNPPPQGTKYGKYAVHGLNGRDYVFVGFSNSGFAMFMDRGSFERKKAEEKDQWMRENKVGPYREGKKPYIKKAPSEGVQQARRDTDMVFHEAEVRTRQPEKPDVPQNTPLSDKTLDLIYRFMLSQLFLDDWHRAKYERDGWPARLLLYVKSSPKGDLDFKTGKPAGSSCPTCKQLARMVEERFGKGVLKGVPGAYLDKKGEWTFFWQSGVVFPMYNKDGLIYRLRVRMDFMDCLPDRSLQWHGSYATFSLNGEDYKVSMKGFQDDTGRFVDASTIFGRGSGGKYRTLASGGFYEGTPSGNEYSIYTNPGDDNFLCYIVEGEPKSMYSNFVLKSPVVSVPGVNSFGVLFRKDESGESLIDNLRAKGVDTFVVAYDADAMDNVMVQKSKEQLFEKLRQEGTNAAEAGWGKDYMENKSLKGLDDLLSSGKKPRLRFIKPTKGGN